MLIHQVEMLVSIEEPEGESRGARYERVDPGLDAHRVGAPIGAEHEEMPRSVERLHPRDEIGDDLRPLSNRLLEGDVSRVGRGGEPRLI